MSLTQLLMAQRNWNYIEKLCLSRNFGVDKLGFVYGRETLKKHIIIAGVPRSGKAQFLKKYQIIWDINILAWTQSSQELKAFFLKQVFILIQKQTFGKIFNILVLGWHYGSLILGNQSLTEIIKNFAGKLKGFSNH